MKKYIKFFTLVVCAVFGLAFIGCASSSKDDAEIDRAIKSSLNTLELPQDCGNGLTMSELKRSGKYVTYVYLVDEDVMDIGTLQMNSVNLKDMAVELLAADPLLALAKSKGYGVKYLYKGKDSGESFEIKIEADEF